MIEKFKKSDNHFENKLYEKNFERIKDDILNLGNETFSLKDQLNSDSYKNRECKNTILEFLELIVKEAKNMDIDNLINLISSQSNNINETLERYCLNQ